jgi:hypothetical protein
LLRRQDIGQKGSSTASCQDQDDPASATYSSEIGQTRGWVVGHL